MKLAKILAATLALVASTALAQVTTNPTETGVVANPAALSITGNAATATTFATATGKGSVTITGGAITTASTSLTDLTGVTLTFTTGANPVVCGFSGIVANNTAGSANNFFNLAVDGALQLGTAGLVFTTTAAGLNIDASFTAMTAALTEASHTLKVQWKVSAGTGSVAADGADSAHFWCYEIR